MLLASSVTRSNGKVVRCSVARVRGVTARQCLVTHTTHTHTHHDPHLNITHHYWAFGDCGAVSSRAFRGRDGDENDPGFARFGRGSSEIEAGALEGVSGQQ